MGLPCLATEQYPKGLGHTVPELGLEGHGVVPHTKTCFSMAVPSLLEELRRQEETKSVILCGIETHACIHHTTLDLLELVRAAGAHLTTSEGLILGLAADSAHPRFK